MSLLQLAWCNKRYRAKMNESSGDLNRGSTAGYEALANNVSMQNVERTPLAAACTDGVLAQHIALASHLLLICCIHPERRIRTVREGISVMSLTEFLFCINSHNRPVHVPL